MGTNAVDELLNVRRKIRSIKQDAHDASAVVIAEEIVALKCGRIGRAIVETTAGNGAANVLCGSCATATCRVRARLHDSELRGDLRVRRAWHN